MNTVPFVPKITKAEFDKLQPRCHCPCNQLLLWKERYRIRGIPNYLRGHHPQTEEAKQKVSKSKLGKKLTEEHKKKLSVSKKGKSSSRLNYRHTEKTKIKISNATKNRKPWNKGKKMSDEFCRKNSESHKGQIPWMKGKHHTEESKQKNREKQLGHIPYNKGKPMLKEIKNKISKSKKGKFVGNKNPAWIDGRSYLPYCEKFNNTLKEAVRKRDNNTCQLCNKTEKENGEKQTVHHIHYDKENCYPDLICLCRSCNTKVNKNKKYYENLFMNKLNDKGLLFWTRENIK